MPLYEYRCPSCDDRFELRRPISEADAPTSCPAGHNGATRLMAVFAATGRSAASGSASEQDSPGPCSSSCVCYPD